MSLRTTLTAGFLASALLAAPFARGAEPKVANVTITEDGVQPATVMAKAGQPVKLVVLRKTDSTCMKDIVGKDFGVQKALPLNQPVTVEVKPAKAGTYKFVCGMGMELLTLKVQ